MLKYENLSIHWLGHDGFRIETQRGFVLYIDPFELKHATQKKADLLFVTHHHFDHCSPEDIKKILKEDTTIVCTQLSRKALKEIRATYLVVKPGDKKEVKGIPFEAVPAYNTNKFRDPVKKIHFHPKEEGLVGYAITIDGTRVYHTGDSDFHEEMKKVKCDIALLPVSGTYVMTADEAAEAAKVLKPKLAIPMHWGSIIGIKAEAERFKELVGKTCEVQILEKEN